MLSNRMFEAWMAPWSSFYLQRRVMNGSVLPDIDYWKWTLSIWSALSYKWGPFNNIPQLNCLWHLSHVFTYIARTKNNSKTFMLPGDRIRSYKIIHPLLTDWYRLPWLPFKIIQHSLLDVQLANFWSLTLIMILDNLDSRAPLLSKQ